MRAPRTVTPRSRRARAALTATAAFVVLAALVPATASAADTQEVDAALPYVCAFPSGPVPATVRISADFPQRARAGESFSPTGVATTVELPAEAVAVLAAQDAAEVRAETRLAVGVAQNSATATATWRGSSDPVALPASGPLTLTAKGDVPSVTGRSDGDLTFTAGDLVIDLAPDAADDTGSGTEPGPLAIGCSLAEDAPDKGLLATVPAATDAPGASGSPSAPASEGPSPAPGNGQQERQGDRAPKVLENSPGTAADRDVPPCKYDEQDPPTPRSLNTYVTGYANVKKQKGASYLPPSCVLIRDGGEFQPPLDEPPDLDNLVMTLEATGEFNYQGRKETPPYDSTFLSFDFTPVKATMVLKQTGPMKINARMTMRMSDFFTTTETYVRVPLIAQVTALEINGVPLDVGPSCRTETSLTSAEPDPAKHPGDHVVLYGKAEQAIGEDAVGYTLLTGGPLAGEVTIPAFTGCGTGREDLDRLLTASVSGPGNHIKQVQGQTCTPLVPVFETPDTKGQCTEDLQPFQIPVAER
ncbi:hypothetical protein ROS62_28135 [Streptomyces sp. DSM 41972]|uniref:DUF6801 domain-containing protein n=1 Tax=Streptomyces althioticus subsp. attaecolombicae TaxID=3075534 RepID=A0ABU3I6E6_9ACTN|nr:hypothetical protein [Streptomyces sp. DSM 41972]SCD40343.1 hypothetical protein GA0115245_10495 [Streptomyces sp. di188]SCD48316.1 hypothetical protein GA0115238_11125 [Streptomyces sp. di50b]